MINNYVTSHYKTLGLNGPKIDIDKLTDEQVETAYKIKKKIIDEVRNADEDKIVRKTEEGNLKMVKRLRIDIELLNAMDKDLDIAYEKIKTQEGREKYNKLLEEIEQTIKKHEPSKQIESSKKISRLSTELNTDKPRQIDTVKATQEPKKVAKKPLSYIGIITKPNGEKIVTFHDGEEEER